MSEAYPHVLTFPTAVNAATMTSAIGLTGGPYQSSLVSSNAIATPTVDGNSNIFIPSTLSLTLAGSGAAISSLPIEFPVASVITSGNVVHTSIGFTTYSNAAEASAAASAARNYFLQSSELFTGVSSVVPTAILSETAPLIVSGVTPPAVSTTTIPGSTITLVATVPGGTLTSTLSPGATAMTSSTHSEGPSALAKATTAPTGSGTVKTASIKKVLAMVCVLTMAANTLF